MKKIIFALSAIFLFLITGCARENEELHEYSVDIEGKEMKYLSVQEVADLWEIDSNTLLQEMIKDFELSGNYTTETVLETIRQEYPFSPAMVKEIAENIKSEGQQGAGAQ